MTNKQARERLAKIVRDIPIRDRIDVAFEHVWDYKEEFQDVFFMKEIPMIEEVGWFLKGAGFLEEKITSDTSQEIYNFAKP